MPIGYNFVAILSFTVLFITVKTSAVVKNIAERPVISARIMHNNRIFTTEECVHGDTAGQTATIEKQIVEYDSSFHKLQSHTIRP